MASRKEGLGRKLRVAAMSGDVINLVELLDQGAEIDAADRHKRTPLMMASHEGHVECVRVLLERGANVNILSYKGLGRKLKKGDNVENIVRLLDQGVDFDASDPYGSTPLIMTLCNGDVECVKLLLDKGAEVNMRGWICGKTPLMVALHGEHLECVKMLLERGAQTNTKEILDQESPLMWATEKGLVEYVKLLLDWGAEVNMQDMHGLNRTPLMLAINKGHVECAKVLLKRGAQANVKDMLYRESPLMWATCKGDAELVKLLLDKGAKVNMQDTGMHDTALHVAARNSEDGINRMSCLRALLSHPGINIELKNLRGHTAMMDAGYESLGVFNQVIKTYNSFPADSYGKVVLCGNSGAGKTTLTQAIINISKSKATRLVKRIFGQEGVIEPLTAGIMTHQVDSPYANMVIYDLAGHHQYFSSHSAYLESISLNSPAIFLLLQDLKKDPDIIITELYYWSTMIDGVCHKCPQQSLVIVFGTHADLLTPEQLTQKKNQLKSVAKMAISHQKLVDVITINLTNAYSVEMDQFGHLLSGTYEEILRMSPPIFMMCHMMLAFFKQRLPRNMQAISLSDLLVRLGADQNRLINPDNITVVPLLKSLSEQGLIVFIPAKDPNSSWIVFNKESILKKVNGTLFADPSLKEYIHLASNTGIILVVDIKKVFPEYNTDMITQFMIHLELCREVDLTHIITNMAPDVSTSSDLGPLLFCPALVSVERPSSAIIPNNSFVWSIIVKRTNLFFTTRCLHVLLRRLPSEFALPPVQTTPLHSHFIRRCDVWSRGIKWLSEIGVTTIVEMSESFQSFSLAMSSPDKTDPSYLKLARSVLEAIKKAHQEFCPHLDVSDIISCPPEASSDHSGNTQVELTSLKEALLNADKKTIVDATGQKYVSIVEWIKIEPCLLYLVGVSPSMATSSSAQLLAKLQMGQPVPLGQESPRQLVSERIGHVVMQLEGTPTMSELLCFSDEKLNIAVLVGAKYSMFGIFLMEDKTGTIVEALEVEHCKNAERINMAILQRWLQGKGLKPVTWSTLVTALQKSGI